MQFFVYITDSWCLLFSSYPGNRDQTCMSAGMDLMINFLMADPVSVFYNMRCPDLLYIFVYFVGFNSWSVRSDVCTHRNRAPGVCLHLGSQFSVSFFTFWLFAACIKEMERRKNI